ncbi:MAG: ElyC/SanA/YdcF family protein [Gillisia sp.]
MEKLKKIIFFFLLISASGLLVIWGLHAYILNISSTRIYHTIDTVPASHTVIILGASVHSDGKLSPILQDRVDTGLKLYNNGKVKRFLLSGDNRKSDYDEVSSMKNYLMERDVPESHIFTDPAGIDTYDSMYRSHAIFEVPSAIVVTQQFHLPRTIFIAKNLGLDYSGYPADSRRYKTEASLKRREKLANFKAVYELIFHQKPANMGQRNPVMGGLY